VIDGTLAHPDCARVGLCSHNTTGRAVASTHGACGCAAASPPPALRFRLQSCWPVAATGLFACRCGGRFWSPSRPPPRFWCAALVGLGGAWNAPLRRPAGRWGWGHYLRRGSGWRPPVVTVRVGSCGRGARRACPGSRLSEGRTRAGGEGVCVLQWRRRQRGGGCPRGATDQRRWRQRRRPTRATPWGVAWGHAGALAGSPRPRPCGWSRRHPLPTCCTAAELRQPLTGPTRRGAARPPRVQRRA